MSTADATSLKLDPRTYARGLSCVHCGLCLPACPTYTQTHNEADSPRGRIQLMLALSDGAIDPGESVTRHLDLCLDCRACETACPSGVVYHELIEETRQRLAPRARLTLRDKLLRWMFFHVFTHPTRLKLAILPARILQKAGILRLFRSLRLVRLLPDGGSLWPRRLPERTEAKGSRRVGFLPGCVGSVMFDETNRKAVELLAKCGATVLVPPSQDCCGAIHHHNGSHTGAVERARKNIDAFLPENGPEVDWIATTIAGCGAMLRDYGTLLRDDPAYAARAALFGSKVRDITEVLLELGLPEMKHRVDLSATYHDACHLAHAQRVVSAPRQLLAQISGLRLTPLSESDMCCGAAGTYNLTQPEMAGELAARKLSHIASTGAPVCVTGNVGCAMHIQSSANACGQPLQVVHTVDLIHKAVFGPD